jgi:hypothetical protein
MKYVKILGLLAVTATALMAFAGTASATITSPAGTKYGGEIIATSTNFEFDSTVDITCSHSEVKGKPTSAGATNITLTTLTFTGCSRSTTTTATGTLAIASDGTVRSTGARVTMQTTIFGFPVHCIYKTENTVVGKLTENVAPAKWHIGSAPIPQEETSSLCGEDAEWTGTFTVTKPATAIVID